MLRFENTPVLLTGAGSGIGRATALRLVSEGARVLGVDRDAEGLAGTADLVPADSPGAFTHRTVDVTDETQVVDAVAAAVEELGGLQVLVNVAGMHRTTPIDTLTVADLQQLFAVNLVGTALFCREALRHLPDRVGVIVNVASSSAGQGTPYMTAYSASKGAVVGFSRSLAAEVVGRGIRVVPLSPGTVDTPLTQNVDLSGDLDLSYLGRVFPALSLGKPEQMAAAIAFAASPDAALLTGAEFVIDGGARI